MPLRELHSDRTESIKRQWIHSASPFPNGYRTGNGACSPGDEMRGREVVGLGQGAQQVRSKLYQRMATAAPYSFSHGDPTNEYHRRER